MDSRKSNVGGVPIRTRWNEASGENPPRHIHDIFIHGQYRQTRESGQSRAAISTSRLGHAVNRLGIVVSI